MNTIKLAIIALGAAAMMSSCGGSGSASDGRSDQTGWPYNDAEWGGTEKLDYEGQITAPNLVLIEGGTFLMGQTEDDVTFEWNNSPRRVTINSFYIDETEVPNSGWREYTDWIRTRYVSYPQQYVNALPDTLVWREELSYNETMVETYYRHPSYDDYPVVGVSWLQVQDYCKWRTDRVNEMLLIERGILNPTPDQKDSEVYTTETYLAGQYTGSVRKNLEDKRTGGERAVRFEDGILMPSYRLPSEAEWEYAALGLIGNRENTKDEMIESRKIYPWNGTSARYQKHGRDQGKILANFKRGRGDYMGTAGKLNDKAAFTAPVRSYLPNDYGLYNMAGNVNEWVDDVYRPLTSITLRDSEQHDLNPYRGNRFKEKILDEDGRPIEKDSLGRLQYRMVEDEEVADRDNYKRGDVVNYEDGDNQEFVTYDYGRHTLISDKSRVIKGGSWADRLYWLSPGTRRYKDEDKADKTLGFRCAMNRVGGVTGNEDNSGNDFKDKPKKIKRRYN